MTSLSDEWKDRFDSPHEPTVPDGLHADLSQAYDGVKYGIGVCSPAWATNEESAGCYNVSTTCENFNSLQVHDHVRASFDGSSLSIHSIGGKWEFQSERMKDAYSLFSSQFLTVIGEIGYSSVI